MKTAARYRVSSSAGSRPGRPYAVVDTHDGQEGKGMRRVSFHRTFERAASAAKKKNSEVIQ